VRPVDEVTATDNPYEVVLPTPQGLSADAGPDLIDRHRAIVGEIHRRGWHVESRTRTIPTVLVFAIDLLGRDERSIRASGPVRSPGQFVTCSTACIHGCTEQMKWSVVPAGAVTLIVSGAYLPCLLGNSP
jgi:hypothetical protein